jgi:hypothetical protein
VNTRYDIRPGLSGTVDTHDGRILLRCDRRLQMDLHMLLAYRPSQMFPGGYFVVQRDSTSLE